MLEFISVRDLNRTYDNRYMIVRSMKSAIKGATQIKELSPTPALFDKYLRWKNIGLWDKKTFDLQYVREFLDGIANKEAIYRIKRIGEEGMYGNIALACFCHDSNLCHRSIIAGIYQGYFYQKHLYVPVSLKGSAANTEYYDMFSEVLSKKGLAL